MPHLGQGDKITTVNAEKMVFADAVGKNLTMDIVDFANNIKGETNKNSLSFLESIGVVPNTRYNIIYGSGMCLLIGLVQNGDTTGDKQRASLFLLGGGVYTNPASLICLSIVSNRKKIQVVAKQMLFRSNDQELGYVLKDGVIEIWMKCVSYNSSIKTLLLEGEGFSFSTSALAQKPIGWIDIPIQ